eukprot:g26771.t1
MSRVKGLSLDEKRKRMLEHMLTTKQVFTLKELEKVLPKQCGIVAQSVKEVLQSLVDDNMVDSDKIGSGNYFWALPSKATRQREGQIEKCKRQLELLATQETELTEKKQKLMQGREPSEKRASTLSQLAASQAQLQELDAQLAKFADSDPEKVQQLEKAIQICKDAANRWTDNIYLHLGKAKERNYEMNDAQFFEHFSLPKDLECICEMITCILMIIQPNLDSKCRLLTCKNIINTVTPTRSRLFHILIRTTQRPPGYVAHNISRDPGLVDCTVDLC